MSRRAQGRRGAVRVSCAAHLTRVPIANPRVLAAVAAVVLPPPHPLPGARCGASRSPTTGTRPSPACTRRQRSMTGLSAAQPYAQACTSSGTDRAVSQRVVSGRGAQRWCYGCSCSDAALGDDGPASSMSSIAWCWRSFASLASSSDRRRSAASALAAASWRASASSRRRRTTSPRYWSPLLPAASVRSTSAPGALLAAFGRSPAASRSARGISQRSFPPWADMGSL